ncbi:hypothetical protein POM88_047893 [Heracleum sosnowskyi]|uniref:Uncharacterized protein n=1 Tax=Heracleum sosnowskyi TaxID=360622 RepID=A0AAD8GSZ2_9APIA|nr:hypothetical protein POM88_047893 [Heracleum sosnowskyi]
MTERCLCGNWVVAKTAWTTSNAGLIRRINNLEAQQKRVEYRSFGGCSSEIEGNSSEIGGCSGGSMSSSTAVKENNSGNNITLTLLIVTWIAIFVFVQDRRSRVNRTMVFSNLFLVI